MELFLVFDQYPVLFVSFAVVLGLVVGSFLNVVILRMPPLLEYQWKKDFYEFTEASFDEVAPPSIAYSRSHCPKCKKQLLARHNVPLLGFLFLKGQCGFCHAPISVRYPFIEVFTGILTGLAAYYYGFGLQFVAVTLLVWFLIVITWIDLDTYLIPDQLSLSLLWLGLFVSLLDFSISPTDSIIGALVGYLVLWIVFQVFKILTGKEGMGYGDFKLLAAGGAWLGYEPLILVLLISSVSGLLVALIQMMFKKSQSKIPFGPYLSIGILLTYMAGDSMMHYIFKV